jgi:hypothetical protein
MDAFAGKWGNYDEEWGMGKTAVATSSPRGTPCKELITFEVAIMSRADIANIMLDP